MKHCSDAYASNTTQESGRGSIITHASTPESEVHKWHRLSGVTKQSGHNRSPRSYGRQKMEHRYLHEFPTVINILVSMRACQANIL